MAEVILSTPTISVLGGPATVKVELDPGSPGKRGSSIFFSNGDPNLTGAVPQNVQLLDVAINILSGDPDYRYLYQYQSVNGVNTWVKQVSLAPNNITFQTSLNFVNGRANLNFPVIDVIGYQNVENIFADYFNVQATAYRSNGVVPITIDAVSLITGDDDLQYLSIDFNAAMMDILVPSPTIAPLSGPTTLHLSIAPGYIYSPLMP